MDRNSPKETKTVWIVAAIVAGILGYWLVFFAAVSARWQCFSFLLLPDLVVMSWVGGDSAQFCVSDRLLVLLAAGATMSVAFVLGRLSLALARADGGLSRLERLVFSTGVGLSELSLLTLAVGLAGGLRNIWAIVIPIAAVLGAAGWAWKRGLFRSDLPTDIDGGNSQAGRRDWLQRWGLWLGAPFLLLILFGGMLPPWDFDVREYHLQVPKEWYQNGRIAFLPHNVYGNMPLGAEMHALLAMVFMPGERPWWWGAIIGKTVIAGFAPLTALALYAMGRRFASKTAGVVAALVFISLPWVVHESVNGLIEVAFGFYALLALYAILLCIPRSGSDERGPPQENGIGRWALAGFLAGSAAACKYPALLFVAVPVVGCSAVLSSGRRWQTAAVVSLAVLCGCGLWFGKNWVQAGNPIYPLVFGGQTRTADRSEQWDRAHRVPPDENGNCYTGRQAAASGAQVAWKSPWQSPILIPLALLGLLFGARFAGARSAPKKEERTTLDSRQILVWTFACYAAFYLSAWWLMTHRIDRFWVPLLPVLAMLAGIGATWSTSRLWRSVLANILAVGLLANFMVLITTNQHDHRYLVALDTLRVDEPDEPDGPSRVHAAHRYLNSAVSPDQHVLLVGDAQPFDLDMPVLYNTCFDECIFEGLMKDHSRAERLAALRKHGISHILITWSEIDRYRSPGNYGFTDYVTRTLVRDELVRDQQLLKRVDLGGKPKSWEVFEVVD